MDIWVIKETCLDRDYETASTILEDGWSIIDIGAGLGDFSIDIARRHAHSTVYAYEPFPESFTLLQENVELNRLNNVRIFPSAVGAESSSLMTLYPGKSEAVQYSTVSVGNLTVANAVQVPSTTLDQIFEDLALQKCDFLKIDCEGAEYEILFNTSKQTLNKIKHICLEYHNGVTQFGHEDLVRFFQEKGFQVNLHPNRVHQDLGFLYAVSL